MAYEKVGDPLIIGVFRVCAWLILIFGFLSGFLAICEGQFAAGFSCLSGAFLISAALFAGARIISFLGMLVDSHRESTEILKKYFNHTP